jgi:hypothetical protein
MGFNVNNFFYSKLVVFVVDKIFIGANYVYIYIGVAYKKKIKNNN